MRHLKRSRVGLPRGIFRWRPAWSLDRLGTMPVFARRSGHVSSTAGDEDRPRSSRLVRPAGLPWDEGAELEASAAAVVVAERIGVVEAAAAVGLHGSKLGPGEAR